VRCNIVTHVKWVHFQYDTTRPQVADGGNGLQIWRVAANILNKQSRTADKGWSSRLGLGVGLTSFLQEFVRNFGPGQIPLIT
jgi:hypothetical protein